MLDHRGLHRQDAFIVGDTRITYPTTHSFTTTTSATADITQL